MVQPQRSIPHTQKHTPSANPKNDGLILNLTQQIVFLVLQVSAVLLLLGVIIQDEQS